MGRHDLKVDDLVFVTGDTELTGLAGEVIQIIAGEGDEPDQVVVELARGARVPIPADQLRKVSV